MASRIYNRTPLQVNTPDAKSVRDYFFSHHNWKGVNKDKNFLTVDQETFSDANNVYVNGEGLLRSRPAIKRYNKFGDNINDIWTFENIVVIKRGNVLCFYTQSGEHIIDVTLDSEDVKLICTDNKIFIFTVSEFKYFDTLSNNVFDATDFIYIPKTTFDAANVKTSVESKNILTTKEIYTYLYNTDTGISVDAYGKNLKIKIQDEEYEILYTDDTKDVLADVRFKFNGNINDVVVVSERNSYAWYSSTTNSIHYSATGTNFTDTFNISEDMGELIAKPKFSQNGLYLIIATTKSIYIVSVLSETTDAGGSLKKRFETFTDLYQVSSLHLDEIDYDYVEKIVFDFADWNDFVIGVTYSDKFCIFKQHPKETFSYTEHYAYNGWLINVKNIAYNASADVAAILNNGSSYAKGAIIIEVAGNPNSYGQYSVRMRLFDGDLYDTTYEPITTSNITYSDIKVFYDKIVFAMTYSRTNSIQYAVFERGILNDDYGIIDESSSKPAFISNDGLRILTENGIYFLQSGELKELLIKPGIITPVGFTDYVHYLGITDPSSETYYIYSSLLKGSYELIYEKPGEFTPYFPSYVEFLNNFYFASNNTLHINEYREDDDGNFLWYIPVSNRHVFDKTITNLHAISTVDMGVFFNDEVWYVNKVDVGYTVTKSKLEYGVKESGDVITSYDGRYTMFCSKHSFSALTYQDFIASTDQALVNLSDPIYELMLDYSSTPVKLLRYDFWVILYKENLNEGFIFDMRNNSWWPISCDMNVVKMLEIEDLIVILSDGKLYYIEKDHTNYFDDGGKIIDWFITSQKLHLSASNFYKHIVNLTLSSVIDVYNPNEDLTYDMDIINYRKRIDQGETKTIAYKVQAIRTYVKRLNHSKVNEFQYTLRTDYDNRFQLPLSLSDITVKYKITGQVR